MEPEEKRIYDEMNLKDKERFKRETEDLKKKQREARKAAGNATDSDEESVQAVVRAGNIVHMCALACFSFVCIYHPQMWSILCVNICTKLALLDCDNRKNNHLCTRLIFLKKSYLIHL